MELANEFVARNTLNEFYGKFGITNPYPAFETNRTSTAYNTMVKNYTLVIDKIGLNKTDVLNKVRKNLFEESYTSQEKGLVDALAHGKKSDGSLFSRSEMNAIVKKAENSISELQFQQYLENAVK